MKTNAGSEEPLNSLRLAALGVLLTCLTTIPAVSQSTTSLDDGFLSGWFAHVARTQAEQPHWITPVFTTTPRLEEEFRYDIGLQQTAKGDVTNYGVSKGLELIPTEHAEIIISPPPYIAHDNPNVHDGFGDMSFLLKYRLLAGNEEHGNYIITAFLGASIPTGSYTNGARNALVTPTFAFGKGWGNFDIQSTVGVGVPVGDTSKMERSQFREPAVVSVSRPGGWSPALIQKAWLDRRRRCTDCCDPFSYVES